MYSRVVGGCVCFFGIILLGYECVVSICIRSLYLVEPRTPIK